MRTGTCIYQKQRKAGLVICQASVLGKAVTEVIPVGDAIIPAIELSNVIRVNGTLVDVAVSLDVFDESMTFG